MEKPSRQPRELALNLIDILVLVAFAFVQPLLGLLGRSAGFFLAHRSKPIDLLVLVLCAYAVPAALPILLEWSSALLQPRALRSVHKAVLSLLLAVNVLPVVRRTGLPGTVCILVALCAGVFLALVYMRIRTRRLSLAYLSPAVLLFPILLLFFSPASTFVLPGRSPQAITARIGNPVPIILVVFDEFPLSSLMDGSGQIDAEAYPSFAELAREATWYRGATTVGESTLLALPAIVSGRCPDPNNLRLPDTEGYPNNLFTLLGGAYRMNVRENNTRLCPERLCGDQAPPAGPRIAGLLDDAAVLALYAILPADLTHGLPDVTQSWGNFRSRAQEHPTVAMWMKFADITDWHERPEQFQEFVRSIQPSAWPTVNFLHILLPHAPWDFLPSGQSYARPEQKIRGLRGVNNSGADPNAWVGDSFAPAQSYQRHLLQVGYVDRLVGSLLKHLRETGLYDRSLLILTADHGTSFRPGDSRRGVTRTNYPDLISVPLFIKYPHQRQGGIDDRVVENIDILPTVLDVLKLRTSYQPEGASLRGDLPPRPARKLVTDKVTLSFPPGLDALYASVRQKVELFGGARGYDIYRLGDRYAWTGRKVPAGAPAEAAIKCRLDGAAYYSNIDPVGPTLLTQVTGRLQRARSASPVQLAVAVNGTVQAVTQSYSEDGQERFAAVVPGNALRAGQNEVSVYSIRSASGLGRIPAVTNQPYAWGTSVPFGVNGSAGDYYGIGWGNPESGITWTVGHRATLNLPVPAPPGDVTLTASMTAFAPAGKLPSQRVHVFANRHEVAEWTANGEFKDYTAQIPKADFRGPVLEIAFDLPDAASPFKLGAGSDARTLGIAIATLKLELR